jgi:hypothetical protein
MKSFLMVVLGFVLGVVVMMFLAPAVVGVGTGVGIATGLKAGACLTVEAAKDKGFITAAQVDEVLNAAAQQIVTTSGIDDAGQLTGADQQCQKFIADLKNAAQKK